MDGAEDVLAVGTDSSSERFGSVSELAWPTRVEASEAGLTDSLAVEAEEGTTDDALPSGFGAGAGAGAEVVS